MRKARSVANFVDPDVGSFVDPDTVKPSLPLSGRMARFIQEPPTRVVGQLGVHSRPLEQPRGDTLEEFGGRVTDVTGSPALGTLARMTPDIATSFVGMGAGAQAGKAAAPAIREGATTLMQSALKPSVEALRTGKAARAIQTMFDEGINVSKGGLAKLKAKVYDLNDQIAELIKNSPATVDKGKVAAALQGTLDRFIKTVNPKNDLKVIEDAWTEFMSHPMLTGKQEIPVKLAQEMKQATYREVEKKYGELGSASVESQKALARGLKEEIAKAVPEVTSLNKQESELLNALSLVEKRALLEGNKNPGGLAWLANNPKTWALYMADKSSAFKSVAARIAYKQAENFPKTVGETIGATVGEEVGK